MALDAPRLRQLLAGRHVVVQEAQAAQLRAGVPPAVSGERALPNRLPPRFGAAQQRARAQLDLVAAPPLVPQLAYGRRWRTWWPAGHKQRAQGKYASSCAAQHLQRGVAAASERGLRTVAIAIAISASVTVSMGELTTGDASLILFVRLVCRSTCCGAYSARLAYVTAAKQSPVRLQALRKCTVHLQLTVELEMLHRELPQIVVADCWKQRVCRRRTSCAAKLMWPGRKMTSS